MARASESVAFPEMDLRDDEVRTSAGDLESSDRVGAESGFGLRTPTPRLVLARGISWRILLRILSSSLQLRASAVRTQDHRAVFPSSCLAGTRDNCDLPG